MRPLLFFAVFGLAISAPAGERITRAEVIQIAEAYLNHEWQPTGKNAFHGKDPDGIRIDTPDVKFRRAGTWPGWWVPNQLNRGIPYMWGGFSSIDEFDDGIRRLKFAGDIYTPEKRRRLERAVTTHAVGIDCSGLVSRCWKLEKSYSTRMLPAICTELADVRALKKGDIMNQYNGHVLLFRQWTDAGRTRLLAYEAGASPTWAVALNEMPLTLLIDSGYMPYRYSNIID